VADLSRPDVFQRDDRFFSHELLRRAMLQEQYDRLEAEAAAFFSDSKADRNEAKAFQKASLRSFGRD